LRFEAKSLWSGAGGLLFKAISLPFETEGLSFEIDGLLFETDGLLFEGISPSFETEESEESSKCIIGIFKSIKGARQSPIIINGLAFMICINFVLIIFNILGFLLYFSLIVYMSSSKLLSIFNVNLNHLLYNYLLKQQRLELG
jgi:hypothetical protein